MIKQQPNLLERATEIAQRDQLCLVQATRRDTGELIWLVRSRSNPGRYCLLTVSGETIHCACPQAEHHGICAHAAAVRLALQAETQHRVLPACPPHTPSPAPQAPRQDPRSASRREQERQQRAEAERRERALLWTDDRPFSVWK
jgi:hypothetical protein